jgi:ribosomal subunit interface protein
VELVIKSRGEAVGGHTRAHVERKLAHLLRLDGGMDYVEIELIREKRGRIGGGHRAEASCRSGPRTYRASASGKDVDGALDRLVRRIERQITDGRGRRRARLLSGAGRVKSRGMSAFKRRSSATPPPGHEPPP